MGGIVYLLIPPLPLLTLISPPTSAVESACAQAIHRTFPELLHILCSWGTFNRGNILRSGVAYFSQQAYPSQRDVSCSLFSVFNVVCYANVYELAPEVSNDNHFFNDSNFSAFGFVNIFYDLLHFFVVH